MGQTGSVYKQPETEVDDSCHSWEGAKKVEGDTKGGQRGASKGREKVRGLAPCIYVTVLIYVTE